MAECQCSNAHTVADATAAIRHVVVSDEIAAIQKVADAAAMLTLTNLPQAIDLKALALKNDPVMHSNELSAYEVFQKLPPGASYMLHEHDGRTMLMHRPDTLALALKEAKASVEAKEAKTGDADPFFGSGKYVPLQQIQAAQREYWAKRPS